MDDRSQPKGVEHRLYFDFEKRSIDDEISRLLLNVANNDRQAFAALYKLSSPRLYGIIQTILRYQQLSSDALQETYLKIWLNASKFDPVLGSPLAWMAVIARRQALDTARQARHLWLADELGDEHPSDEISTLETRIQNEKLRTLLLCLSKLDARKRDIIMYAYYRGASRKDLSLRLGIPVPTVKTQLRRVLAEIKDSLGHSRDLSPKTGN